VNDVQAHNVLLCAHTPLDQALPTAFELLPSSGKHLVSNRPEFRAWRGLKESMSRTRKFEHLYIEDGPETPTWERRGLVFHWAAIGEGALLGMLAVRNSIKKLGERPAASLLTS